MASPVSDLPQTLEHAIEDYHAWANAHFLRVEKQNAIEAPLYHYTDMRGFEGILTSGTIWFTDYRHLNDPQELLHGLGIAKRMLQRHMLDGGFRRFLFGTIDDMLNQRNFDRALEFFIASFRRNSNELGQWRAYADNAHGVSIGFSPTLFLPNEAAKKDPRRNVFVGPVLYNDARTRRLHAKGIDKAAAILDAALIYAHHHLRDINIGKKFLDRLARSVIASPLIWNALTCKHNGYNAEREVRLVMLGDKQRFRGKVSTRKRSAETVRYVPYRLPDRNCIVEVVVDPAAPETTRTAVRTLLNSHGIKARIRRSQIPYRA